MNSLDKTPKKENTFNDYFNKYTEVLKNKSIFILLEGNNSTKMISVPFHIYNMNVYTVIEDFYSKDDISLFFFENQEKKVLEKNGLLFHKTAAQKLRPIFDDYSPLCYKLFIEEK